MYMWGEGVKFYVMLNVYSHILKNNANNINRVLKCNWNHLSMPVDSLDKV